MIFASFYQFLVHFQSSLYTLKQDAGVWTLLTGFVFLEITEQQTLPVKYDIVGSPYLPREEEEEAPGKHTSTVMILKSNSLSHLPRLSHLLTLGAVN